jgi:hypothetical protein
MLPARWHSYLAPKSWPPALLQVDAKLRYIHREYKKVGLFAPRECGLAVWRHWSSGTGIVGFSLRCSSQPCQHDFSTKERPPTLQAYEDNQRTIDFLHLLLEHAAIAGSFSHYTVR